MLKNTELTDRLENCKKVGVTNWCLLRDMWNNNLPVFCHSLLLFVTSAGGVTCRCFFVCFTNENTLNHKIIHSDSISVLYGNMSACKKVAHTRLPSVWFRSWSRFLAVSLQVTWVINPAVGCHYFLPGLQVPSQPLRGLLPISLLGEQSHDGCEQFA